LVRVRYTPYWRVARGTGCVSQATGGWTLVRSLRPGFVRIAAAFDPRRILDAGVRCSSPRARP
jgi:hypothetical protein